MRPLTFTRLIVNCLYLAVILFVVMVIALKLGAVPVSLYGLAADLLQVLFHRTSALSSNYDLIVIDIRLPRILLGIVVGASLSVAGTAFQALLRNPLADPYILGASSGRSLRFIFSGGATARSTATRCCFRASYRDRFCRRSLCSLCRHWRGAAICAGFCSRWW